MKVLITGSHFTVAQAVIEELKKYPEIEIVYVGRKHTIEGDKTPSVESQVLPELGVKFISINTGRLRRYISIQTFISLFKIPIGFIQAFIILLKEKPDIVVSFGGYVGVPVVISAWLLSIPIIIHEQTLVSGLANTISSLFANKIAVTFDKTYDFPKSKTIVTGNPMRNEIFSPTNISQSLKSFISKKGKLPLILITGGNQGSHSINEVICQSLNDLLEVGFVIHQTGDSEYKDYEKLIEQKKSLKKSDNYLVSKWFSASEMGFIMKHTQIAIARGGMNTLLEFAYFGIPSIIIPLDGIYRDEQNVNAKYFKHLGLADILPQKNLSKQSLLEKITDLLTHYKTKKEMAVNAKRVVVLDSAKILSQEILITLPQDV